MLYTSTFLTTMVERLLGKVAELVRTDFCPKFNLDQPNLVKAETQKKDNQMSLSQNQSSLTECDDFSSSVNSDMATKL